MKSDLELQNDVQDQLKWTPLLNAAEIGVSVKNGIVTLSGHVDSYLKKMTAERAVKKVAGVKAVAEELQVGISPADHRTDTEIAEAVVNALKWHSAVPADKIKIKVEGGSVTLEGQVEWDYQRKAIRRVIETFTGVKSITDCLYVKPGPEPGDIKKKINAAFHRSASLDAEQIQVEMKDHTVVLRGTVRSFAEREDAENAAWSAPGIGRVENHLDVQLQSEFIL